MPDARLQGKEAPTVSLINIISYPIPTPFDTAIHNYPLFITQQSNPCNKVLHTNAPSVRRLTTGMSLQPQARVSRTPRVSLSRLSRDQRRVRSDAARKFVGPSRLVERTACMPVLAVPRPYICARCLRAKRPSIPRASIATDHVRQYANATPQRSNNDETQEDDSRVEISGPQEVKAERREEGALSRRLRSMSEEAIASGAHGAVKAVQESGGFSEELKAQLEQRIAGASLRSSEANLPAAASRHVRDLATSEAWTGTESIHDASLRMLNDSRKPLRLGRPPKMPGVQPPRTVDTGHKRNKEGHGQRLADARDRSTVYAHVKEDVDLDAMERETRFQLLKDRFDPHARTIVPGTISGIASLASQRIEDAIARGQFNNIKRGKGINVERDHNASSPFIDTTEYFLNKMIQKQEIVPPWIEKQQELTSAANKSGEPRRMQKQSSYQTHPGRNRRYSPP
ncbi:hypothetical protein LEMA_P015220.1 [Plenodomus lingam JN3]|uniref:DnaJ homologue subfamily C member 28 conserved domain-containing protein n=1 Tax=Leptosphaeria maculans (strain JN3 / isolate v23.1.3 / race Av1-4-5-6-7-8) TaxID=985895 RepID=E5A9Q1_LEPMJ|nr:hypothetical protein LEMA_P015220.1 [Plenodomus lingam JN3]CBY00392.1 hypothetical protein LEMA_P015220.1 [Plenodomus lingam JN3]